MSDQKRSAGQISTECKQHHQKPHVLTRTPPEANICGYEYSVFPLAIELLKNGSLFSFPTQTVETNSHPARPSQSRVSGTL